MNDREIETGDVETGDVDRTEAFIRLLTEHERKLGVYAMMLIPHVQDCDEVLQEAKLVMWRSFDRFTIGTDFSAWARKVVFHQVLKYRRRPSRRLLPFCESTLELLAADVDAREAVLDRRQDALNECITRLAADHREILRQRYRDEMSIESIAEKSERTTGAIYRLLSRIRHSLYDCVSGSLKLQSET